MLGLPNPSEHTLENLLELLLFPSAELPKWNPGNKYVDARCMNTLHFEGMLQLTFIQICVHLLFASLTIELLWVFLHCNNFAALILLFRLGNGS
jgi:hypothetical protein